MEYAAVDSATSAVAFARPFTPAREAGGAGCADPGLTRVLQTRRVSGTGIPCFPLR